MVYDPRPDAPSVEKMRSSINVAKALLLFIVGLGVFLAQAQAMLGLLQGWPLYLYLALLASVLLLMLGWVIVSSKESEYLSKWMDSKKYDVPTELIQAFGFAVILLLLLYSTAHIFIFACIYVSYSIMNVAGWYHLRTKVRGAVSRCRTTLKDEPTPSPRKNRVFSDALDLIERYYLKRNHIGRAFLQLALAAAGLIFIVAARRYSRDWLTWSTYATFVLTIIIVEGLIIDIWRYDMYCGLNELAVEKYEIEIGNL